MNLLMLCSRYAGSAYGFEFRRSSAPRPELRGVKILNKSGLLNLQLGGCAHTSRQHRRNTKVEVVQGQEIKA